MTMTRTSAKTIALLASLTVPLAIPFTLGGCFYANQMLSKSAGGNMSSDDTYTYISTPYEPLTVTLYDNRDNEPLWTVDVPVGSKVSLRFLENKVKDGTTRRPDIMQWAIYDQSRRTARYDNTMAVPPAESRMMRVSLRQGPEFPEERIEEQQFPNPDHQWLPVEERTYRSGSASNNPSSSYSGN